MDEFGKEQFDSESQINDAASIPFHSQKSTRRCFNQISFRMAHEEYFRTAFQVCGKSSPMFYGGESRRWQDINFQLLPTKFSNKIYSPHPGWRLLGMKRRMKFFPAFACNRRTVVAAGMQR